MTDTLRQQLIDTALAMNASGVNQGASGNLSVRHEEGFLITPSGMDYAGLSPDDIVWMDFDGNSRGRRKPSSEWHFHAAIYKYHEEANAVLHAHPVSCTTLACLDKGIPAFHYMVSMAGGKDIRCADYATFGTVELADAVACALKDRNACLMANHGQIACGENLGAALDLAREVEALAALMTLYGQRLMMTLKTRAALK